MNIDQHALAQFRDNGFFVQSEVFAHAEIKQLVDCLDIFAKSALPGHVKEKNSDVYRAFHGCHLYSDVYSDLVRKPEFLQIARSLLNDEVYIHQLKVNLKQAFSGETWPWHQDYIYWRNEDKVPTNSIVSVMIYLDDITEFNGPLFFIPRSHKAGCIEPQIPEGAAAGWEGNVSALLTYQVSDDHVTSLVAEGGLFSAKGNKGTAVWFDGNIVHASPPNLSPSQRRIAILTYNAVSNAPLDENLSARRPDFLNARDRSPLQELGHPFGVTA